jgi:hypothetical protein
LTSTGLPLQAFLIQRAGVEHFSWFFCVQSDDATNREAVEAYDVDFDSLEATWAQPIRLPPGASPIGSAPDRDGIVQMYFRAGQEIWCQNNGTTPGPFHHGLPEAIQGLSASGPLVVTIGAEDHEGRAIGIHSLQHRGRQSVVAIEEGHKLVSKPLFWFRWLYTVELDPQNRLFLYRRTVSFEDLRDRS